MVKSFTWERDMKKAIERSTAEQKPILLDFFLLAELAVTRWVRLRIPI